MKASKRPALMYTSIALLWITIIFQACTVLKDDPDAVHPVTKITGKEVYLNGTGSAIIDLNTKIQTNLSVTLSVTSQPTEGSLTSLGKGILQYNPTRLNQKFRDSFQFTVYGPGNEVIQKDTLVLIVETDTTQLPCGIYPNTDYVYNVRKDTTLFIDVLSNDYICDLDSTGYDLSIYTPESDFPPYYGAATIINNRIVKYTPNTSFAGYDKFIYRIQSRKDAGTVAYGFVYIQPSTIPPGPCVFTAVNDTYGISLDSITTSSIVLPVFQNDILCDSALSKYSYRIVRQGDFSTSTIDDAGITYRPDFLPPGTTRIDSIRYELCLNQTCRQASVYIKTNRK